VLALIRGEAISASKSDDDKPAATPLTVRPETGLRIPPLTEGPQPA
jgi:hypothetical protein